MPERATARIRRFHIEDMHKILEIEQQAFPKTAYSERMFREYAKGFPDGFFVIEVSEDIVGYIIFDMSGHIHSTAVKDTHRRKGFGKMLFLHAQKCANTRLWLEVRSKNHNAVEFYKKLGMKIVGMIPNYYETDNALIMVSGENEPTRRFTLA
jgi:ribosomal protein S18 acetylase RimI-like enzyme